MNRAETNEEDSCVIIPRVLVWYWGTSGAGGRFALRLASELSVHMGNDNLALSLHKNTIWRERFLEISSEVDFISGKAGSRAVFSMLGTLVPRFIRLCRQVRRFRPSVIVIPMNFGQAWPICSYFSLLGHKIIYVVHDATPHPGDYAPRLQKFTQVRLIKSSRHLVALSKYVGATLSAYPVIKNKKNLSIIPLSAHIVRRVDLPRSAPAKPVRFLFLGRLLNYKGLDILADALAPLANRDDWRLTIAGHGREKQSVIKWFSPLQQVNLNYLKTLNEDEIDELIQSHDVLICSYTESSQSGALVEALAFGVPSIVTPVGALSEQLGHGTAGWVSNAVTPEAVSSSLTAAISEIDLYAQKSSRALELCADRVGDSSWYEVVCMVAGQRP